MPNWTYLSLHFFHTLALALWIGGIVALGALTAPTVFRLASSRETAGAIMLTVFRRFDIVVLGCIVALSATSAMMIAWFGRLSAWYAIEYVSIAMMSASALFSYFFISPRLRALRDRGESTGADFQRLHRSAEMCMQFNLACGAVALLFS